jgi:hypothetical protein
MVVGRLQQRPKANLLLHDLLREEQLVSPDGIIATDESGGCCDI